VEQVRPVLDVQQNVVNSVLTPMENVHTIVFTTKIRTIILRPVLHQMRVQIL